MKPEMRRIAPALERWCREAPEGEERTVIVRTARAVPADAARRAVEAAGAVVESAGEEVTTARVTCASLQALAARPEVVTIDEPREMFPKFGNR
jgi:hypothetical protein